MNNLKNIGFRAAWSLTIGLSFFSANYSQSAEVQLADAPTNDLALTVNAIQSAKKSLLLNIYELTSPEISQALAGRIQAGVEVQIIEEGQPVGGLSTAAKGVQSQLVQEMQKAGGSDRLYEMTSKATPKAKRRFRFDHAKYAVIDGEYLLIGSENYSPTGNPQAGTLGNRGWEVYIHDSATAKKFESVFQADSDTSHGDLLVLAGTGISADAVTKPKPTPAPLTPPPSNSSIPTVTATDITVMTSPDSSLSGLVAAINSAKTSLDIEQMTFDSAWGKTGTSPLLDAVTAAANRGVKIRVLLNDEQVFNHSSKPSKPKNVPTADTLNQVGHGMSAKIANVKAMGVDYIHNKGMLIDGEKVLISSINWDETSVDKNREAAVLITSQDAFNYYEALFDRDWQVSGGTSSVSRPEDPISSVNPECLSKGTVLPVNDSQVINWKTTTPNQYLARAHVQGTIGQIYPNENGHQHFEVILGNQPNDTIEMIYNISFGSIPVLKAGMSVEACGDYITSDAPAGPYPRSPDNAIMHWVHMSNSSKHDSGFVAVNGVVYGGYR